MTEADKILELIENVASDDTDTLDEIDARAWCWLYPEHPIPFAPRPKKKDGESSLTLEDIEYAKWVMSKPLGYREYTRSRDSLKAIRPEGWYFMIKHCCLEEDFFCQAATRGLGHIITAEASTEELAELHAIIQAIKWERNND